ncbi:MAG: UDP-glucose/GDP-mannose dehydrogenase family protein [Anaerolineales bacterium]|nr:UDP-glucose/GDP-mannose dehydrogenase family protein [Anaerolineales bacterium]
MRKICVVGVGYVGLVTGTCFADLGNQVTCLDIAEDKIAKLQRGEMPIYEPGLEELVARNVAAQRLIFTTNYLDAVSNAEFIFIAVGTPSGVDGEADLQYVRMAAESIADTLTHYAIIVNKSTVPVGTGDSVAEILIERGKQPGVDFDVVSNPEFLREGSAMYDFQQPDRVVLGALNREAADKVAQLYLPLRCPIMITDLRTAEMIKYASNAFLATRISFINEMAAICEKLGADIKEVAAGMGMDKRIGRAFLDAGVGFGGSCFPKDVKALTWMAEVNGCHPQLLRAVMDINRDQRRQVIAKLRELLGTLRGKTIALWGLAFKPNTDDVREAPALDIIHILQTEGAQIRAYDPVATAPARRVTSNIVFCESAYAAVEGADALVLMTEWNEFKQMDMARVAAALKQKILVDGRNIYEPEKMQDLGLVYRGIGRGY